jgi:PAS domain S-box-containing protein
MANLAEHAVSEPLRVLIVEDSEDDAHLVLRALRRAGYEPDFERVESAASMRAALAARHWDLILCDYVIPGFGGLEALELLQSCELDLPFILLSNKVSEEILVEAMRAGAKDFILKDRLDRLAPVIKRELLDAATRQGLQQAQLEWRTAFDAVHDAMFIHDAEFHIMRANLAYAELAGMNIMDIIGKLYWEVFPKTGGPLPQCKTTREMKEITLPNGATYLSRAFPILDVNGNYRYALHVLQDITERSRAELALRESESKLSGITNCAHDAIIMMDNEGKISYWNTAAEKIFGYTTAEAMGQILHKLLVPERYFEAHCKGYSHFRETGEGPVIGKTLELIGLRKNGKEFPVELSLSAIKLKDQWNAIGIIRDISERKQAERTLRSTNRTLQALSAGNELLIHAKDEQQLLQDVCRLMVDIAGYRLSWIGYVEHDAAKCVRPVAYFGIEQDYIKAMQITWADTLRGQGPTGRAVRSGLPEFARDMHTDPHFAPWREQALLSGYASSIALPLINGREVFGILTIYSAEPNAFNENEVTLLSELANDLAFGIITLRTRIERDTLQQEQLRSAENMRQTLLDTIGAVALMVEKRDPYTAGHQLRVSDLCVAIGLKLGLPEDRIEGLRLGAIIHDIGKIYVPAEILNRPGKLTMPEFELIKVHPQVGYDIIKDVKFPWPVAQMILQHHERLDGSGYPQGLNDEQIIFEAKIIAVADVIEAMSSHRPYRPTLGIEKALAEIERGRGTFYDPAITDACIKLFREEHFSFQS